jgi:hypothetical protein
MSELVDPAKARRLGQMLGVQGLVIGTISDVGSTLDVDARIIDIQTDVSLPGASASIVKDEAVKELGANCSSPTPTADAGDSLSRAVPSQLSSPRTPSAGQKQTVGALEVEMLSCRRRADNVQCNFRVQNLLEDREYGIVGEWNGQVSRAVDDRGAMYTAREARVGDHISGGITSIILPSSVPVLSSLTFQGIPPEISLLSMVEITYDDIDRGNYKQIKIRFRNVPIQPMIPR